MDSIVFYIGRNNKKLDQVFGFVKLFAEASSRQKYYDRGIGVDKVLPLGCRVCEGDGGCRGVTRPDNT